jgi:ABC-type uncharacterized transport system permease subunit
MLANLCTGIKEKKMTSLLIFGAGMLAGIMLVGIVLNLTVLKQDRWKQ